MFHARNARYAILAFVILMRLTVKKSCTVSSSESAEVEVIGNVVPVFIDQQCILHSTRICQHRPFPDPGYGIQQVCYLGGCAVRWRRERWSDLRLCLLFGFRGSVLCKPGGMDLCGCIFIPGIFPCPEKDEEDVVQVKNNCETSHQSRADCEKINNVIKNERIQYEYFKRGAPDTWIW